jgi:hypothetical protein
MIEYNASVLDRYFIYYPDIDSWWCSWEITMNDLGDISDVTLIFDNQPTPVTLAFVDNIAFQNTKGVIKYNVAFEELFIVDVICGMPNFSRSTRLAEWRYE